MSTTMEEIVRRIVREELAAALAELEPTTEPTGLPELLSELDVAAYTGLSQSTLANWRAAGTGPPFVKVGRLVRYRRDELLAWLPDGRRRAAGKYLGVTEAAARARAHPVTLRRALEEQSLHGYQPRKGGRWSVDVDCLDAWTEGRACPHGASRAHPLPTTGGHTL